MTVSRTAGNMCQQGVHILCTVGHALFGTCLCSNDETSYSKACYKLLVAHPILIDVPIYFDILLYYYICWCTTFV